MKQYYLFIFLTIYTTQAVSQALTVEEAKLYDLIMEYRREQGLPAIPVSRSLTLVAQTHVADLQTSHADQGNCNAHSWSSKGKWTPCCYTPDHKMAGCMWNKPRELTAYPGNGYEIGFGQSDPQFSRFKASAESALSAWKSSPGHNAVIINQEPWVDDHWQAIGIGINGGFAVVWFGEEADN